MNLRLVAFCKVDETPLDTLGKADLTYPSEAELIAAVKDLFSTCPRGTRHRHLMVCLPGTSQLVGVDEQGEPEGRSLWATYRALAKESADISKEKLKDLAGPFLKDRGLSDADRTTILRLLRPGELTPETISVVRRLAPEAYKELAERLGTPWAAIDPGDG